MKIKTIAKLCCPFDKKDLKLDTFIKDIDSNVLEGLLTCLHCSRKYPIVYGVPIMSPDDYRQTALEKPIMEKWKIEHGITDLRLLPESL